MVSVTSTSRYRPRYQSRSSMYILGLNPRNFAELANAVPVGSDLVYNICYHYLFHTSYRAVTLDRLSLAKYGAKLNCPNILGKYG